MTQSHKNNVLNIENELELKRNTSWEIILSVFLISVFKWLHNEEIRPWPFGCGKKRNCQKRTQQEMYKFDDRIWISCSLFSDLNWSREEEVREPCTGLHNFLKLDSFQPRRKMILSVARMVFLPFQNSLQTKS